MRRNTVLAAYFTDENIVSGKFADGHHGLELTESAINLFLFTMSLPLFLKEEVFSMVEWFSYLFGAKDVELAILMNTHLDTPLGPEKFTVHICNFVEILS